MLRVHVVTPSRTLSIMRGEHEAYDVKKRASRYTRCRHAEQRHERYDERLARILMPRW